MASSPRANWSKTASLAALAVYWGALFVATHLPRLPALATKPSDKLLHFTAFALLGFLLAVAWSARGGFGRRQFLTALAVLAVYAAFDEVTQPLVNRHADVLDWVADMAGALAGLTAFAGVRAVWSRVG